MIPIFRSSDTENIKRILRSGEAQLKKAEAAARRILNDVRREGDRALKRWTLQLDKIDLAREGFTVKRREIDRAYRQVPGGFVKAVQTSARNIRRSAREQLPRPWQMSNGRGIGVTQMVRPLDL